MWHSSKFLFLLCLMMILPVSWLYAAPLSLQVSSLAQPIPAPITDGNILVYELHLLNVDDKTLRVGLIEISDENGNLLGNYSGKKLEENSFVYQEGSKVDTKDIELKKGMGAFVYIWIVQPKNAKLPKTLLHKIWIEERFVDKGLAIVEPIDYQLEISKQTPVVLEYPLRGANWVAAGAPAISSYHRRTILPIEGKFYLAQRYAVDWVQVCANGNSAIGDIRNNENWVSFSHEVLAVDNGIVSLVNDGMKENSPPEMPTSHLTLSEIPGNYVILKINQNAKDFYVLYAHMQPGSIRVKKGDKVKSGQVIGLLGNTGNSSAPHLHLHVSDANDPLRSEGIPFIFKEVTLLGTIEEIDGDYGIWSSLPLQSKSQSKNVMPSMNQVFNFTSVPAAKCPQ